MKIYSLIPSIVGLLIGLTACSVQPKETPTLPLIPLPNELTTTQGEYALSGEVGVWMTEDSAFGIVFEHLKHALRHTNLQVVATPNKGAAAIRFQADTTLAHEAYRLHIHSEGIDLSSAPDGAGLFYGLQTLLQLMPTEVCRARMGSAALTSIRLPQVSIADSPRFPYRGAMMDVARNFLPKEDVLRFIELMAVYKLNRLHLHLTDDQGWRLEIKKYPELTQVGARRERTQIGHSDVYFPRRYNDRPHEGFYTQEDIREIVAHAARHFITVIPEIEMPGHASAALATYPALSCGLGKTYTVRDHFDVFDEVYCPKEATFSFLEDVLTEVMELFPSHYIHIGGDECPKKAWKKCSHCQALMKREGLASEEELQSWFIHRIERFVNSRGRDIIGWDEILEGGLAPNATVMSWRGEAGGIAAAKQQHRVIMTPGSHCYFDFYQEAPEGAPVAMGGYLPLDTVYAYDPLPLELSAEEQKYIIGTQANVWGEYIQDRKYFDYMTFPRLQAMAEVQWTQPERKDFEHFARRLDVDFERMDHRGVAACRQFYKVEFIGAWNEQKQAFEVKLRTPAPQALVRYDMNEPAFDGKELSYTTPIALPASATIYAWAEKDGKPLADVQNAHFVVSLLTGISPQCTPTAEHTERLTDGRMASPLTMHRWTSLEGDSVVLTFALRNKTTISRLECGTLWRPWNEAWPPKSVSVAVSEDGQDFRTVGTESLSYEYVSDEATRFPILMRFPACTVSHVRVTLQNAGNCPPGYYHEGRPSRILMDEFEIH